MPWASQASPSASATTRALLSELTAAKSKPSRVLPDGSLASSRWRAIRRCARSAISCSSNAARVLRAGPAFAIGGKDPWAALFEHELAEAAGAARHSRHLLEDEIAGGKNHRPLRLRRRPLGQQGPFMALAEGEILADEGNEHFDSSAPPGVGKWPLLGPLSARR